MDFDSLYKETILRQVKGYNYGIILQDMGNGTVKLGWRTRSYGNHISIADAATQAGFRAGGHRNAGGGVFKGTIGQAREALIDEIRNRLPKLSPSIVES